MRTVLAWIVLAMLLFSGSVFPWSHNKVLDPENLQTMQVCLSKLGVYKGPLHGIYTEQTGAAFSAYARSKFGEQWHEYLAVVAMAMLNDDCRQKLHEEQRVMDEKYPTLKKYREEALREIREKRARELLDYYRSR